MGGGGGFETVFQFSCYAYNINSSGALYLGWSFKWIFICVQVLTRARVAVSATFAMVGGGGPKWPPPLTRKLGKLEGRAIRRSTALSEPVRSHFGHFFAQVNIEVSRGHQRSNFRKMTVLSGMPAIISGTIIATPNPKKAQDSSWNALSIERRQISPTVNRLSVRGHERSKTAFLSETVFQW